MNINDLRPANNYAVKYGAKSLVYGAPGTGKTPITNSAPRPVLCAIEPGLLSMRNSNVPTFAAPTAKLIAEFFDWVERSNETKNFDTICVDSLSEMAEVDLADIKTTTKDNRQVYGKLFERTMPRLRMIYLMQNKHTYLICKQGSVDENGVKRLRPVFPGDALNTAVPHLFDIIMHLAIHAIPGVGQHKAFRTAASLDAVARDRSGKLNEFEPCDLTALFSKVMS